MRNAFIILICSISFCKPFTAIAQNWDSLSGVETYGPIYSIGVFNNQLIIGGGVGINGSPTGIVKWENDSSYAMGSGINGIPYAYVELNGDLYVGGDFDDAGGASNTKGIARWWSGTNVWGSVGGGLTGSPTQKIRAMAVYNGELYVGGQFQEIGGMTAYYIARWDGSSWSTVSNGISGTVRAMAVYKGELYVGGSISWADAMPVNYIVRWDGTQWKDVKGGLSYTVSTMVVDSINDVLYIGGGFLYADANDPKTVNSVAMWDGIDWYDLDNGITGAPYPPQGLTMYHGELYAAGYITAAGSGNTPVSHIAKWDGGQWHDVGGGTNTEINALQVWNDTLYAGGFFTTAGGDSAYYIAKWHSPEDTTCTFMQAGISLPKDTVFYTDSGMVQFSDASTASAQWWWDFGDGVVDSVRDPVHVYDNAGVYNISLAVKYNNCPDTAYATVTVIDNCSEMNAAIAASADTVYLSDTAIVQFYDSSNFANSWQWDFGDGASTGSAPDPVHTYDSVGVYEVQLVVNAGYCWDTAVYTIVVEQETGTPTLLNAPKEILKIYPNPAGDDLTIEVAEANQSHTIHIYDVKGRRVKQLRFSENVYTFSTDELSEGIYYVTLQGKTGKHTQKLVIRR